MTVSATQGGDQPLQLLPETELDRLRSEIPLRRQLEAYLFIAHQPLPVSVLAAAAGQPEQAVRKTLREMQQDYAAAGERGIELREIAGGYRFYVCADIDPLIADFVQEQQTPKLSQAALETLAVIAYKQPISRGAVAAIRAVNVDSVVRTLVTRGLVVDVGQDPETGAILYGTTPELLEHLGLNDISELPPIAPLLDDGAEGFADEQF